MANTEQLGPEVGSQGASAWYFDDTIGELVPSIGRNPADLLRNFGTGTARFLVNRLVPHGTFMWLSAAGTAVVAATETTLLAGSSIKKGPLYSGLTIGTVPAGYLNQVGKTGFILAQGTIASTGSTPTNNIKFKLGTNVILATGAIATASVTGTLPWFFSGEFMTTVAGGAGVGNILGQCKFSYFTGAAVGVEWGGLNSAVTIDLTAAYAIDLTSTWSSATGSPTMTCQQCIVGFRN
jgi:hypothetical protein